ncbi:hypothetical protein VNO78_22999 [Psophocarpus tetragonolobus]|uniref:Uncharacterized protein n=1 Tax=Psophocarpus tetragonolobus TaxID=3891 RepID=A0AAN9S3Q0_PSOTE
MGSEESRVGGTIKLGWLVVVVGHVGVGEVDEVADFEAVIGGEKREIDKGSLVGGASMGNLVGKNSSRDEMEED